MNVLWLSHLVPYPPKSGVAQRSFNLLKQISKYHNVYLLAFHQPRLFEASTEGTGISLGTATAELERYCRSVQVFSIPSEKTSMSRRIRALGSLLSFRSYNWQWLASQDFQQAVAELAARFEKPYVVHIDTISLARHSVGGNGVYRILNHHNIESEMMRRRAGLTRNPFLKFVYSVEAKKLATEEGRVGAAVSCNLVCSKFDADRLRNVVAGVRIELIPNGADLSQFHFEETGVKNKKVLFIGTLDWYPNRQAVREIAKDILPIVLREEPGCRFDIVGANAPRDVVAASSSNRNLFVHGFVPEIGQYWRSGAVFLCPIRDGGGTKLKIIEAMAAGLAIVAHPVAAEGLCLKHSENALFGESSIELAKHVVTLMRDGELRRKLGKNAAGTARQLYDYDKIGKRLSQCYQDVAGVKVAGCAE